MACDVWPSFISKVIVYHVPDGTWMCVCWNMCSGTSCWEKTGGLLFSSCTVTTTVQELFRPARDIITASVSDSGSDHHTNKVRWGNRKYLILPSSHPDSWVMQTTSSVTPEASMHTSLGCWGVNEAGDAKLINSCLWQPLRKLIYIRMNYVSAVQSLFIIFP